jgi:hypothetical protein
VRGRRKLAAVQMPSATSARPAFEDRDESGMRDRAVLGVQSMTAPPVRLISLAVMVRAQSDAAKVAMLATSS